MTHSQCVRKTFRNLFTEITYGFFVSKVGIPYVRRHFFPFPSEGRYAVSPGALAPQGTSYVRKTYSNPHVSWTSVFGESDIYTYANLSLTYPVPMLEVNPLCRNSIL